MRSLFWKFFSIIWLTLAASIGVVIAITTTAQTPPFSRELAESRRAFALDTAERLTRQDGPEAARRFAMTVPGETGTLAIATIASRGDCLGYQDQQWRRFLVGRDCYLVRLDAPQPGLLEGSWPRLAPWITTLIASAIAAFWLTRYLIGPVAQLRRGLGALAQGRFDIRIGGPPGKRTDAITALADDFDASAARLQQLQETQQRLFHDVSHELRSPLSRLQAALGVLRQNPARLETMLDRMDREIGRIDHLIGEILTLARLSARPEGSPVGQSLDVIDLLNDILDDAAFEGQARGITVTTGIEHSFVARVDGELIYRAIENVVRNALKYAPDNTHVTVDCSVSDTMLVIGILDEGPGVPTEDLESIFRPFLRSGQAEMPDGYGLGLAITRQAVERHGGRVRAETAKGGGLRVVMEIPRG